MSDQRDSFQPAFRIATSIKATSIQRTFQAVVTNETCYAHSVERTFRQERDDFRFLLIGEWLSEDREIC
jgi:hypothetical protein